jgi:hypothetical protein
MKMEAVCSSETLQGKDICAHSHTCEDILLDKHQLNSCYVFVAQTLQSDDAVAMACTYTRLVYDITSPHSF